MSMNQVPAFFNNWALNSLPLLSTLFSGSLFIDFSFNFSFIFVYLQSISVCVYSIIIFWFYIDSPLSSVHPHRPRHVTLRTWPLTAPNNWSIEDPTEIRFDPNRFLWISKLKSRGFAIKISHLYDSFLFNKVGFKGTFVRLLEKHFRGWSI